MRLFDGGLEMDLTAWFGKFHLEKVKVGPGWANLEIRLCSQSPSYIQSYQFIGFATKVIVAPEVSGIRNFLERVSQCHT